MHNDQLARIVEALSREPEEDYTLQQVVTEAVKNIPGCTMCSVFLRRGLLRRDRCEHRPHGQARRRAAVRDGPRSVPVRPERAGDRPRARHAERAALAAVGRLGERARSALIPERAPGLLRPPAGQPEHVLGLRRRLRPGTPSTAPRCTPARHRCRWASHGRSPGCAAPCRTDW
uniref:Uncharacterized protein n=1 Tax=Janibacter limosus TaxID=53458 RepID=A0AC61U7T0_9MICO|nr:hypothetical protein [Janibacter limosus]